MSNSQKTPFAASLNRFAEGKIKTTDLSHARALPASVVSVAGPIVTVKFEVDTSQTGYTFPQVTIPLFGPEYIRYPVQAGDKGFTIPADISLRGVSGLGTGIANLTKLFNLTPLVFMPIGNQNWSTVDPDSVTIYGPNGVVLRDTGSNSIITLTPNGIVMSGENSISLSQGDNSITINSAGITIIGALTINGVPYLLHTHSGVETGPDDSGPVVP